MGSSSRQRGSSNSVMAASKMAAQHRGCGNDNNDKKTKGNGSGGDGVATVAAPTGSRVAAG